MGKYESIIILNDLLNEREVKTEILKFESFINEEGGSITKTNNIGKIKNAYEIKGHKEGIYIDFYFKGNKKLINELGRYYKINDNILRFITIKKEG